MGDSSYSKDVEDSRSCGPRDCTSSVAFEVSPGRYSLLAVYAASSLMAALVWNIMAPVYSIAEVRFDKGAQAINSLANAYYVWYCPGSIFAMWVTERYGLRMALVWGNVTQLVMATMSYTGLFIPQPHTSFLVVWFAQVIGSFGQPLILNNVAKLAGDWFPIEERDMAVTVSVVARSIGVMGISAAAPLMVTTPAQIPLLYVWQVPIWVVITAAGFFVIRDRPDVGPPSASAAAQWDKREQDRTEERKLGKSADASALEAIWADTQTLLANRNFVYLCFSFSFLTGLGWTFLTIVGQILEPCGYSNEVAGLADATFMGFNALGCFVMVPLIEKSRAYLELQQGFSWLTAVSALGVFATARHGSPWAVLAAWSVSGFFMGPLTPMSFEHAAEMTFPVSANSSTTIINILGNLMGFIETVIVTPLLELPLSADCTSVFTWAAGFVLGCIALGMIFTMLVYKDYRRQTAEQDLLSRAGGSGAGTGGSPRGGGGEPGGKGSGAGGDGPHLGRAPGSETKQLLGQRSRDDTDGAYKTF